MAQLDLSTAIPFDDDPRAKPEIPLPLVAPAPPAALDPGFIPGPMPTLGNLSNVAAPAGRASTHVSGPTAFVPPPADAPPPAAPQDPGLSFPVQPPQQQTQLMQVGSSSSSQTVMSPEFKKTLNAQGELVEQQAQNKQQEVAAQNALTDRRAEAEEDKAARILERQRKIEEVDKAADAAIARKQAEYDARVQEQKDARRNITEYWADKPTGEKVLMSLVVMANAALRGSMGQESDALKSFLRISEQDRARKLQMVDAMGDDILRARTGIDDAFRARADMRERVLASSQAANEAAAAKVEGLLLRAGKPLAEVQGNAAVNAIRQNGAKEKMAALAPFQKQVQSQQNIYKERVVNSTGNQVEQAEAFNKVFKDDPEMKLHNEAVKASAETRDLVGSFDTALQAGGSALGLFMTRMASAAQTGVLSDKDMARAMGNDYKSWFERTSDGTAKFLKGSLPPKTINSIKAMLATKAQQSQEQAKTYSQSLIRKAAGVGINPQTAATLLGGAEGTMAARPQVSQKDLEAKAWLAANPNHPDKGVVINSLRAKGLL